MEPHSRAFASSRRGTALLLSLAVLVSLSVLGVVFATLAAVERSVSRNYVDALRARLLAESGVEHALAGLARPENLDLWRTDGALPWVYYGPRAVRSGADPSAFHGFPAEDALSPSFPAGVVTADGREIGISGRMDGGTYVADGDLYTVRVVDLGSKLNVNNDHPRLGGILRTLFAQIPGLPADPGGLADRILARRPRGGYRDAEALREAVGPEIYPHIHPLVTVHGWVDAKIPRPVPLAARRGSRLGRGPLAVGSEIQALWEMRPAEPFDAETGYQPRTPVNINHAPVELLVALLQGLRGYFVFEDRYSTSLVNWSLLTAAFDGRAFASAGRRDGDRINARVGRIFETPPVGTACARAVADAVVRARTSGRRGTPAAPEGTFTSFQQFNRFIDDLDPALFEGIPGRELPRGTPPDSARNLVPMVKDVLKANFNPNVHLNELNPDESLALWTDKTDLSYSTFEFTFIPMGFFEIRSVGRLLDEGRRTIAREAVTAEVRAFGVHRDTTQHDFLGAWARGEAPLDAYFSRAGAGDPTAEDVSLLSHPDIQRADWLTPDRAGLDGYLTLNTIRSASVGSSDFALAFDARGRAASEALNPSRGVGTFVPERGADGRPRGPWLAPLTAGADPGSLGADGLICERGTSPGYANANFNQHAGALSMWVRPMFRPEHAGRPRVWFSLMPYRGRDGESPRERDDPPWWAHPFAILYGGAHEAGPAEAFSEDQVPKVEVNAEDEIDLLLPPRALTALMNGLEDSGEYIGGHASPTLNHAGHPHAEHRGWGSACAAGRWMHVGYVWDDTRERRKGLTRLFVNGVEIDGDKHFSHTDPDEEEAWEGALAEDEPGMEPTEEEEEEYTGDGSSPYENEEPAPNRRWGPGGAVEPPLVRLGIEAESPLPSGALASRRLMNYPADATLDEVLLWKRADAAAVTSAWRLGRYTRGDDAVYTSSLVGPTGGVRRLTPPAEGGPGAASGDGIRLGLFAFTAYWPVSRPDDPALQDLSGTRVSLGVNGPDGGVLMPLREATLGGAAVAGGAGGSIAVAGGRFRYRVGLSPNLPDRLNTPLRVSPVLDDVTITWYDGAPVVLSWIIGD